MANLHISISAEPIFYIGDTAITNSILTSWIVSGLLILFAFWFHGKIKSAHFSDKPSRLQGVIEFIISGLYNLNKSIAGTNKKARSFFPLVATFFLFIIFSNWSGLFPGVGTIGIRVPAEEATHTETDTHENSAIVANDHETDVTHEESAPGLTKRTDAVPEPTIKAELAMPVTEPKEARHGEAIEEAEGTVFVPLFRGPTADINTTLALALFSVVSIQVIGFQHLGVSYGKKYLNFSSPIYFFVGLLELISEISRIISFAFRLFGNIFAGEVLLVVIAFLIPILLPIPFIGLEIFVGFIQALVFAMLTLVFLNIATISHDEH